MCCFKNNRSEFWDHTVAEGKRRAACQVQSTPKRVLGNQLSWDERLTLCAPPTRAREPWAAATWNCTRWHADQRRCREVLEGATELRLMLCREKRTGTRVGTSVVAACGVFAAQHAPMHSTSRLAVTAWQRSKVGSTS